MPLWNKSAASYGQQIGPVVTGSVALKSFLVYASIAVVGWYGATTIGVLLGLAAGRLLLTELVVRGLAALSALRSIGVVLKFINSQRIQAAQEKLSAGQRAVLGLPPPAARVEGLRQRKPILPVPPAQILTPLSTPQRYVRPAPGTPLSTPFGATADAIAGVGATTPVDFATRTPMTGGSNISRPSPHSAFSAGGRGPVATPHQLQAYLDAFNKDAASPQVQQQADSGLQQGYGAYTFPGQGAEQEPASSPALPMGVEAPKYRPSWLPRAKTVVTTPDVLTPSSEDEVQDVMTGVLKMRRAWLERWTDELREWFSAKVVKPLVGQVEGAHEAANKVFQKYNIPTRLPPLPSVIMSGQGAAGPGGGSAIGGGAAGVGGGSAAMDVEALLRHAVATYCNGLYAQGQQQDAVELHNALTKYEQLHLLLRGKRPQDLLPPAPSAYIWARIQQLAGGTCLDAFKWNGGGSWGGRMWSPDLPSDTGLLLYLFAAFLDAPGWEFSGRQQGEEAGRGMPLYLGQVRPRAPSQHTAILSYRPDKPSREADALLGLNLAGAQPMVALLLEGRIVTMAGYQALFHAIIMMLQYHKVKYNSMLGPHMLGDTALGLDQVIRAPAPGAFVSVAHTVFGSWFPPSNPEP